VTKPQPKKQTMTRRNTKRSLSEIKDLIAQEQDVLRPLSEPWPKCMSKESVAVRLKRSPKNSAAMSLAPRPSAPSTDGLDEELERFTNRALEEEFPYLILDARYEKVRQEGVIRSRAVLVALGVDWEGRRQVLGVELANRESATSWKEFLLKLKGRGLGGGASRQRRSSRFKTRDC
jgi:hypothetical protein